MVKFKQKNKELFYNDIHFLSAKYWKGWNVLCMCKVDRCVKDMCVGGCVGWVCLYVCVSVWGWGGVVGCVVDEKNITWLNEKLFWRSLGYEMSTLNMVRLG